MFKSRIIRDGHHSSGQVRKSMISSMSSSPRPRPNTYTLVFLLIVSEMYYFGYSLWLKPTKVAIHCSLNSNTTQESAALAVYISRVPAAVCILEAVFILWLIC